MNKMQFAVSILIQYYVESGFWSVDRQDTASDLFSCSSTCVVSAAGCSALGADTAVCCRHRAQVR